VVDDAGRVMFSITIDPSEAADMERVRQAAVTAVQGRLLHRRICNLYKRKQENSQPKSVWTSYNLTSTPARFASSCSSSKQPFSVYALTTI